MFAYLFQGVAFWLILNAFADGRAFRAVKYLLFANLVLSVGGAIAACIDVGWALTPFGLAMFVLWNVVLIAAMGLIIVNRTHVMQGANKGVAALNQ
jgi:hypothetical protein